MYFKDLTYYQYLINSALVGDKLLNVGWLDPDQPFDTGDVSNLFFEKLERFIENPKAKTRGYFICKFCHGKVPRNLNQEYFKEYGSSAEIRVPGDNGVTYAAPILIRHYIQTHKYLPPAEFVKAVEAYEFDS